MKRTLSVFVLAFVLAGCSMTPTQKKWTGVAVGVLVVGAIAAHQQDHGNGGPGNTVDNGHLVEIPCNADGTC